MNKERRVHTKEFKEEAVRLATSGGRSQQEVAKSLNLHPSVLLRWIRAAETEGEDAFRGHGKRAAVDEEQVPQEVRDSIEHYGDVRGSGSLVVTVDVVFDGKEAVLQLLRPYARQRAEAGFARLETAVGLANLSGESKDYLHGLIEQGKADIEGETDFLLSQVQHRIFRELYEGAAVGIKVGGKTVDYQLSTPGILVGGDKYRLMERVPGTDFAALPDSPEKRLIAKAVLALELANMLRGGPFDGDPHGGNVKVSENRIYRYDFGAVMLERPSESDMGVFAEIIGRSLELSREREGADFVACFFEAVRERKLAGEELPPVVGKAQRALLMLSEYYAELEEKDVKDVLRAVYPHAHGKIKEQMRRHARSSTSAGGWRDFVGLLTSAVKRPPVMISTPAPPVAAPGGDPARRHGAGSEPKRDDAPEAGAGGAP